MVCIVQPNNKIGVANNFFSTPKGKYDGFQMCLRYSMIIPSSYQTSKVAKTSSVTFNSIHKCYHALSL